MALAKSQENLATLLRNIEPDLEFLFGRDGALTCVHRETGHWLAGCSLPKLAAQSLLKTLEATATTACFLNPTHAAQIREALLRVPEEFAILVIVPELKTVRAMLACEDFSRDILSNRLWFAAGETWADALDHLFTSHPGLPLPTRFIKLKLTTDTVAQAMISAAQDVFGKQQINRGAEADRLRANYTRSDHAKRVCVIVPSRFRLWENAGLVLAEAVDGSAQAANIIRFNPDDPAGSSPLALAEAAHACGALFTADLARDSAPHLLAMELPWISWITGGRIPAFALAGPMDSLIVTTTERRTAAMSAGWPAARVRLGTWPVDASQLPSHDGPCLALLADTSATTVPDAVEEYSSHRLLWEAIDAELRQNPQAVGDDVMAYLTDRMGRTNVAADGFDFAAFIDRLIVPAYQQGLAALLIRAGLPLKLFGSGWEKIEAFRAYTRGEMNNAEDFHSAIESATVLVHAWPTSRPHPIFAVGRPVLRCTSPRSETLIHLARRLLAGAPADVPLVDAPPLSAAVAEMLEAIR